MGKVTLGFLVCLALTGPARADGYADFNAGIAAHNDHDADGAIRSLSQALAAPDLPAHLRATAYIDRAHAYAMNKQYDPAIADYTSALALVPDDFDALLARGDLYVEKKTFDAARADYAAAIALRPELIDGYYGHAKANLTEHKYDDAIKDYDDALARSPGDMGLLLLRGDAAREAGRYDAAIKDFSDALARNSRYGEAYVLRGRAYLETGNAKAAVSDYEDAIDLEPDDMGLREIAGIAQWEYGSWRRRGAQPDQRPHRCQARGVLLRLALSRRGPARLGRCLAGRRDREARPEKMAGAGSRPLHRRGQR